MIDGSIDINSLYSWVLTRYKQKTNKKIPISEIFKKIEQRYKIKLSDDSKEELLDRLREEGNTILKSRNGKSYIIFGKLDIS